MSSVLFSLASIHFSEANRMESSGQPGKIHVSEKTYGFLENKYVAEAGEEVEGKTF